MKQIVLTRRPMVEALEGRRLLTAGSLPDLQVAIQSPLASVTAELSAARRVYMLGNSLTDGINYSGFLQLLGRDGGAVSFGRQTGPGHTQSQNYYLRGGSTSGVDPQRPGVGNPWGNYAAAAPAGWDFISLQPQERRVLSDPYPDGQGGIVNEAEVPMAIGFMKAFAAVSPGVQPLIYSRSPRRTDVTSAMAPTGQPFDYSVEWEKQYTESGQGRNYNWFTRSFGLQLMPALRAAQAADPLTANLPPARVVPVGEAMYVIDQMIKAGRFAGTGIESILAFYADQSHPTADLGSYVIGLTFYSSITGNDPRGVAPTAGYLTPNTRLADPVVQALLQEAVYTAMTGSAFANYTTPLKPAAAPPLPVEPTAGMLTATVYVDRNRNGLFDSGDGPLPGVNVYLDADDNGRFDPGERSAVSDAMGNVLFDALPAGTYVVRTLEPADAARTSAPSVSVVVASDTLGRAEFGYEVLEPIGSGILPGTASISGIVIDDADGDGLHDEGEPGLEGRIVWVDLNADGVLDRREPRTLTNADGSYHFTDIAGGPYTLRTLLPEGWRHSAGDALAVVAIEGEPVTGADFLAHGPVVVPPLAPVVVSLEGESARFGGGTYKASGNDGFVGTGYADFGGQGSWAEWSLDRPAADVAEIAVRYANGGNADRPLQILINGVIVGTLACPPTGGWSTWVTVTYPGIALPAGPVALRLVASTSAGGGNVDGVAVTRDEAPSTTPNPSVDPPAETPVELPAEPSPPVDPPPAPAPTSVVLEGEIARYGGGTYKAAGNGGFVGAGYADFAGQGSWAEFTLARTTAGPATLTIRYANGGNTDRPLQVLVNGVDVGTFVCPPTGGWGTWATATLPDIALPAGTVAIRLVASTAAGGGNVDQLAVSSMETPTVPATPTLPPKVPEPPLPPVVPVSMTIEGETGRFGGGTYKTAGGMGFTGAGYADFAGLNSWAAFDLTRPAAGAVSLAMRYVNGGNVERPLQVLVNDQLVGTFVCPPTGNWNNWTTASLNGVHLPAGTVTIKLVAATNAGGGNVDSITLTA